MNKVFGKLKLRARLLLILTSLVIIQATISGSFTLNYIKVVMEDRIGQQALQLSEIVSKLPFIVDALGKRDSQTIQNFAEMVRNKTDAEFVVVGDVNGIRFSHPVPERIGLKRVGGDNERALAGESYVSQAVGSLGPSIRGKTPVINIEGEVIGVTSVGYMLNEVNATINSYQKSVLSIVIISLLISTLVGVGIARYYRRVLFGLEPEEIALLLEERNSALETVREGIISVDAQGEITSINKAAVNVLNLPTAKINGKKFSDVLPESDMGHLLKSGEEEYDREVWMNNRSLIVNRVPIVMDGEITGVVSSFRPKDEITLMSQQLSKIKEYAETLRSQSHDYANKLHTIAGLIQIGAGEQALELIGQESLGIQRLVTLLTTSVTDPVLAGCILGKYNRAHELGVHLHLDELSHMGTIPEHIPIESLVSMIGNILDNAFEATRLHSLNRPHCNKKVTLSLSDYGNDLVFEVADQGIGIDDSNQQAVFKKGYSSKLGANHGYGLYLVKSIVDQLGGQITLEARKPNGTRFVVYLPKARTANPDKHKDIHIGSKI